MAPEIFWNPHRQILNNQAWQTLVELERRHLQRGFDLFFLGRHQRVDVSSVTLYSPPRPEETSLVDLEWHGSLFRLVAKGLVCPLPPLVTTWHILH